MLENNPLRQYFRRPSIYFRLPSDGKYYEQGVVNIPENHELPVYPMTAIDEMTVRTPDALFNGAAVVELIKSCVPNIINPWKLNNIDLDATMLAIKAATNDGVMEVGSTCPACLETSDYDIDIMPILADMQNVDYDTVLTIRELQIKFKPLTYTDTNQNGLDQFQIQKIIESIETIEDDEQKRTAMSETIKRLNEVVTKIVANTVDYIKTPEAKVSDVNFIVDFLNNSDKQTSDLIKARSVELREQNELKPFHITCMNCKHEYKQKIVLNVSDFFV